MSRNQEGMEVARGHPPLGGRRGRLGSGVHHRRQSAWQTEGCPGSSCRETAVRPRHRVTGRETCSCRAGGIGELQGAEGGVEGARCCVHDDCTCKVACACPHPVCRGVQGARPHPCMMAPRSAVAIRVLDSGFLALPGTGPACDRGRGERGMLVVGCTSVSETSSGGMLAPECSGPWAAHG